MHQDENRAVLDDGPANGSRLCGRFAALAGMTALILRQPELIPLRLRRSRQTAG
ncbi:MAG: hypothetical protein IH590_17285 [Aquamicrobium sp.]|nr:hypothetical protein [Aquamicrobium sp.]